MAKVELWGNSFFGREDEDCEKEDFLREFGESLRNFIKTGVESKQLEKLVAVEEKFQETCEKRFQLKEIILQVSKTSAKKVFELMEKQNLSSKNLNLSSLDEKEMLTCIFQEISEKISIELINLFENSLFSLIKDMSYLSHVNMLYELYKKEAKIRREEKEFAKISEDCDKITEIVQEINRERRLTLEELEKKMDLNKLEMERILVSHKKYFNVYEKPRGIQVSLSPTGKKFCNYRKNVLQSYSNEAVEQLIYKNCDNLIEAVENYCEGGFASYVKFDNLSPEMERTLQNRYGCLVKKLKPDMDMDYILEKYIGLKKERIYNEISRFRIISEWGEEDY